MQCRICNALKRELGREGETEAAATLRQRVRMMAWIADHSPQDVLDGLILVSRKRQAHLASELHSHQEDVHGEERGQSPGVRKTSP
jgi:hypothetical protein